VIEDRARESQRARAQHGTSSSLVTQMIVAEKYGVRLNMEQLASVLKLTVPSLYNSTTWSAAGSC